MEKRKLSTNLSISKVFHWICSENCDGNMLPNGTVYATYPERYLHICDKCGKKGSDIETYPVSQFVYITVDDEGYLKIS